MIRNLKLFLLLWAILSPELCFAEEFTCPSPEKISIHWPSAKEALKESMESFYTKKEKDQAILEALDGKVQWTGRPGDNFNKSELKKEDLRNPSGLELSGQGENTNIFCYYGEVYFMNTQVNARKYTKPVTISCTEGAPCTISIPD